MKKSDKSQKLKEKETLRNTIRNHIIKSIIDGTYKAGERIVETRLAKELDVSQAPVREAILELSINGLLEEKPYSGTYVKAMTADELIDIFHSRAVIEKYSVQETVKKITPMQLEGLKLILDEMKNCSDVIHLTDLDKSFHEAIIDAAGSPSMKRLWNNLNITAWTYISASSSSLSIDEIVNQHEIIYGYIKAHDELSAGAYMFLHIKYFGNELAHQYNNYKFFR